MWWNILLLALVTCLAVSSADGSALDASDKKQLSAAVLVPASFDYDYGTYDEQRQAGNEDAGERPLVRYWNSFMRNLRIPIPSIQWNMSSPLVSLFTGGTANALETPAADYDATSSNRRKRKKISNKNRQRPFDYDILQGNAVDDVNQQLLLPATIAAGQTVHFVDPKTGQYYEVVQDQESYYNNYYQPAHNYYEGPATAAPIATPQSVAQKAETLNNEEDENDSKEEEVEQHDKRHFSEQQDDDYEFDDDDAGNVAAAANEVGEQHIDGDDDVDVVENLDDDDESGEQLRVTGNVEQMRNAMGAYSHDDRRYRKRHRNKKRDPMVRVKGSTTKRDRGTRVRYFILNTW